MTRKHFNALAAALAPHCPTFNDDERAAFLDMVDSVADVCQQANPNFDRNRFRLACQGA
jgi:hypothetical protein